MTKLASTLPKSDDDNGLHRLNSRLIAKPEASHYVIALIDTKQVVLDVDSGESEATVQVLRIEAVNDADLDDARAMLRNAMQKRTGRNVLPFDEATGEVL